MESGRKNRLKILTTFLILIVLFLAYHFSIVAYASREKLDYESYSYSGAIRLYNYMGTYQQSIICEDLDNNQIKVEVQKIIKPKFYIEKYISSKGGTTYPSLRVIEINKELKGYDYAYVLIHEYIHLKYLLSDESLVDYLSVKLLWESDVLYLQKAACCLVKDKIQYDNGNDYDCTAQLIEYFRINEGIYE